MLTAYVAVSIVTYGNKRNEVVSDAAIILGTAVIHDKPSPVFRERINHGISLYQAGKVKKLIFTGGVGKGEVFAESEVAKKYALQHGVPVSDIFIEKSSTITYENIIEARKILTNHTLNSVLIVSDPLHMKRAMIMAQDLGVDAKTAPTPTSMYKTWSSKSGFLVREICFYTAYLVHRVFI